MADEDKKLDGGDGTTTEDRAEAGTASPDEEEREGEEERPKITLDRYLGSRRRTYTGYGQLVILLFMLVTLVLLLMYKDRCGDSVSGFIFMGTPDGGAPAVRIKLDPESSKVPPASRPARNP